MTGAGAIGSAVIALAFCLLAPAVPVHAEAITTLFTAQDRAADLDRQLEQAEALVVAGSFDEAQTQLDRTLAAARQSVFEPQVARALLDLSDILLRRRQPAAAQSGAAEALAIYDRLDLPRGVARSSYLLALIARASRDLTAASVHAHRALDTYDALQDLAGIARAAMLILDLQDTDLDQSRLLLERAVSSARATGDATTEGLVLHRFGDRLFTAGRYEDALGMLTRAATAYESVPAPIDLGTVYNSIGRVYRAHGRIDEALKFQKAALTLHQKEGDQYTLMQSLNAVAVVYQRLNELATARSYMEQALALAEKIGSPAAQDFMRANMASLLADLGQLAPAAEALEQVIARGLDAYPATRYVQLSEVYLSMGRGRDALAAAEQSLALCGDTKDTCAAAYNARSEAQARLGNVPAALDDLSASLKMLEGLRAQLVPTDFFKQDFHRYYQRLYTSSIALQVTAGEERQALETAELARSRAFLDLLASRSLPPAPAPASMLLPLTFRGGAEQAATATLPVTTQAVPATANDLRATAARLGSTLVIYWVGWDETFIWVVDPVGAIHTRRVRVRQSKLSALVRETWPFTDPSGTASSPATVRSLPMRGATPLSLREAPAAWRELYTLLIAPVRDVLPTSPGALLTIVPHDTLSSLSFAALKNTRGRYLLEDYTLHYAPAGAMFQFTAPQQQPRSRAGEMLLVSDPVPPKLSALDAPLPRLAGARSEAAAIARLIPAGHTLALQDGAATETRVRQAAPDRAVLHFATHAVVRDNDPFASYLALGSSSEDDAADGILTAQDVYGLRLHADLVVLSACRSAGGTVAGDGIATFARAFLYAGTASFVASVWDVADEPTNRLMPDFYRAWMGGATKATALRRAQLRLLADLRAGRVRVDTPVGPVPVPEHPVFWAGFVLFGEPR